MDWIRHAWMTGCWFALTAVLTAQPMTLPDAPEAPRGYGAMATAPMPAALGAPGTDDGWTELLPDLTIRAVTSLYHDSNPGQSPDTPAFPAEPGMVGSFAPELEWTREASAWKATIVAGGAHDENFENTRYNADRYRMKGQLDLEAGRWDLRTRFEREYNDGINRYFGESFAETTDRARITLAYELSPKTSVQTRWQSAWNDRDGGSGSNENHSLLLSGLWRYSPLLEFGPGLSVKRSINQSGRRRDTIGPALTAQYQLSRKIGITSEAGMDFVGYSNGRSDSFLSTRIAADYRLSRLWSFNLSVLRDVEPDGPAGSGFREVTALNIGARRQVRRMSLGFTAGYETNDYTSENGTAGAKPAQDFTTLQLDLGFPILSDKVGGLLFIRHQDSRSDAADNRWDSTQVGASILCRF